MLQINQYIEHVADSYSICPQLIMAMVEVESSYNPDAENGSCIGLMQVSKKWHQDRMDKLGVEDLRDPYGNILVGVDYLAELADKYEDVGLVLMVYNMGSKKALELYNNGRLSGYAEKILKRSAELEEEEWTLSESTEQVRKLYSD